MARPTAGPLTHPDCHATRLATSTRSQQMSQAITHDIHQLRVRISGGAMRGAEQPAEPTRAPQLTPSRDANRVWQHCAPTVDRGDTNRNTEGRRLDDLVVAQIDRDVVDIAAVPVPED